MSGKVRKRGRQGKEAEMEWSDKVGVTAWSCEAWKGCHGHSGGVGEGRREGGGVRGALHAASQSCCVRGAV